MRSLSIATDKYSWVILGFTPFSRSAIDNNVSESPLYCQGQGCIDSSVQELELKWLFGVDCVWRTELGTEGEGWGV